MKLGIPRGGVNADTIEEAAAKIAGYGFEAAQHYQTVANGLPGIATCRRIRRAYEQAGIELALIGGYTNPISTDEGLRRQSVEHLKGLCRLTGELGCNVIATFSGTAVPVTSLLWTPETHSQANYELFKTNMEEVLAVAQAEGAIIAIEPFVVTVMKDVATSERLFRELDSPSFGLVMDVANYFHPDEIDQPRQNELMTEAFSRLRPWIRSIHAKDLGPQNGERPTPSMPAAGRGQMDYDCFSRLAKDSGFPGALIVEHLTEPDIPEVRAYVKRYF
jgi:sugar phosphate isomerase/epimerase